MSAARRRQRGVGLIEILIAVVLVSIGFLAAARMQVEGMRLSQSSYFQSQAHFLANDMIDRIRANPRGVGLDAYDNVDTSATSADPGCGSTTICTPAQQAAQDIFDWRANFQRSSGARLPGSTAASPSGTVTDLGGNRFRVTITWYEIIDGGEAAQGLDMYFVAETG